MDNEGVAYGHYLNHFAEQNTLIVHYALCIVHFKRQLDKPEYAAQNNTLMFI